MKYWKGRKKYAISDPTIASILQESALSQLCSFKLYLPIFPDTYFIILKASIIWREYSVTKESRGAIYERKHNSLFKELNKSLFFFIVIYKASI